MKPQLSPSFRSIHRFPIESDVAISVDHFQLTAVSSTVYTRHLHTHKQQHH